MNSFMHADTWSAIRGEDPVQPCKNHALVWKKLLPNDSLTTAIMGSVKEASYYLESLTDDENRKEKNISVLVTGSLHLVGTFISVLDPKFQYGKNY